jgi:NAD(P)-dependent dehydrogenase (short-subunit alcohol dehydrogenase family)
MPVGPGEFPESARSLIFISSSNATIAAPERGEYAMSKAAVAMMAKLYAIRLAPHSIAVYEVRPGLIRTPMTRVAEARFDNRLAQGFTPINRWGTPEDVGKAIATATCHSRPAPRSRSMAAWTFIITRNARNSGLNNPAIGPAPIDTNNKMGGDADGQRHRS